MISLPAGLMHDAADDDPRAYVFGVLNGERVGPAFLYETNAEKARFPSINPPSHERIKKPNVPMLESMARLSKSKIYPSTLPSGLAASSIIVHQPLRQQKPRLAPISTTIQEAKEPSPIVKPAVENSNSSTHKKTLSKEHKFKVTPECYESLRHLGPPRSFAQVLTVMEILTKGIVHPTKSKTPSKPSPTDLAQEIGQARRQEPLESPEVALSQKKMGWTLMRMLDKGVIETDPTAAMLTNIYDGYRYWDPVGVRGLVVEKLRKHMSHRGYNFQPGKIRMTLPEVIRYLFPYADKNTLKLTMTEVLDRTARKAVTKLPPIGAQLLHDLAEAFRHMNVSKTGFITSAELESRLPMPPFRPEDGKALFKQLDVKGDGVIDFLEFVGVMREPYRAMLSTQ